VEHSSTYRGVVKGMREDYDDKSMVCVEVELPAKKSKANPGPKGSPDFKLTRNVTVSQEMAASLSMSQAVEVETTVRPFGKFTPKAAAEEKS
jgi:hypothetical protein